MTSVPNADATDTPSAHDFAQCSRVIQERLAGAKRQFVDGIDGDVVAHIEDARSLVASQAIHVLRTVRLASADRPVVNGMGPGVATLKRQATRKAAFQAEKKGVIGAG